MAQPSINSDGNERLVKTLIPKLEHRSEPLIASRQFLLRLAHSGAIAVALVSVSLLIGVLGYHLLEGLTWIDAFLNAAMLLGGMGPVDRPVTLAGKLFAGLYALYCGLAVLLVAGVILAPIAHRILHRFHVESRGK
jgi:hypothetical protein